jgi:hypothetical protein
VPLVESGLALPPPSAAHPPAPPAGMEVCCPDPGAFLLSADYLLLTPRRQALDYAIVGTGPSTFGPQGDFRSLSFDPTSAFRAGGGYCFGDSGVEVAVFYTYLHAETNDAVGQSAGGSLLPTLTHPGVVESVTFAAACAELDYQVLDVEVGKHFQPCETLGARVFAGPRFARIDQHVGAFYDGGDASQDLVGTHLKFDGYGARAGGEATWQLFEGFGVYSRAAASLMVGNFRDTVFEANNDGASPITNVTDRFHKVVPVVEVGLGLSYQYHNFRVTAGYEFIDWLGLVDTPDFVSDTHVGKPARRIGDLGFDGLVLRAEFAY